MKRIKFSVPIAAFALGIGLAAVTSLSSFTKNSGKSGSVTARYYNKLGIVNDTNPADFIYKDGLNDHCDADALHECSAQWTTTNAPMLNQSPTDAGSPSRVTNSGESGDYNL